MDTQLNLLSLTMSCPVCLAAMKVDPDDHTSSTTITVLSAQELFQASNGMGLPDEQDASVDRIHYCMKDAKIEEMVVDATSKSNKTMVDKIIVIGSNGRFIIHFGSSPKGATIFRIEKA